jgi:ketosteroid isomerase-like protein
MRCHLGGSGARAPSLPLTALMSDAESRLDAAAVVHAHLHRIERGQIAEAIADYADDAVLEAVGGGGIEDSFLNGIFQGRATIGRWIDNWFSSFEPGSYHFEVSESVKKGDHIYLALRHTARGATSGVDVTNHLYHVFTVQEAQIARHAFAGEREPMLRAAGIDSG